MSKDSSNSPALELIQLFVTSAQELDAALSDLRSSTTFPCVLSILQETALTQKSESTLASDFVFDSTTSHLH